MRNPKIRGCFSKKFQKSPEIKEENTMILRFHPKGVCSQEMRIQVEDGIVTAMDILGGCQGNLEGLSRLVVGMKAEDVADRLEGIQCGFRKTSCPDQLAHALRNAKDP